jgi:cell division protein FtsQ
MVLLLTGEIDIPEILRPDGQRIIDIRQDVELKYLMEFARLVQQNPFWNDQIVQVYRSTNGDYEIIPRVGAHQIQFGKMENYETKLNNLKLLYDKGLKKYGWNNYNKINLKYSNQIICTKR